MKTKQTAILALVMFILAMFVPSALANAPLFEGSIAPAKGATIEALLLASSNSKKIICPEDFPQEALRIQAIVNWTYSGEKTRKGFVLKSLTPATVSGSMATAAPRAKIVKDEEYFATIAKKATRGVQRPAPKWNPYAAPPEEETPFTDLPEPVSETLLMLPPAAMTSGDVMKKLIATAPKVESVVVKAEAKAPEPAPKVEIARAIEVQPIIEPVTAPVVAQEKVTSSPVEGVSESESTDTVEVKYVHVPVARSRSLFSTTTGRSDQLVRIETLKNVPPVAILTPPVKPAVAVIPQYEDDSSLNGLKFLLGGMTVLVLGCCGGFVIFHKKEKVVAAQQVQQEKVFKGACVPVAETKAAKIPAPRLPELAMQLQTETMVSAPPLAEIKVSSPFILTKVGMPLSEVVSHDPAEPILAELKTAPLGFRKEPLSKEELEERLEGAEVPLNIPRGGPVQLPQEPILNEVVEKEEQEDDHAVIAPTGSTPPGKEKKKSRHQRRGSTQSLVKPLHRADRQTA